MMAAQSMLNYIDCSTQYFLSLIWDRMYGRHIKKILDNILSLPTTLCDLQM